MTDLTKIEDEVRHIGSLFAQKEVVIVLLALVIFILAIALCAQF